MAKKDFSGNRLNIYATDADKALIHELATRLHQQGIPGMLNADGKSNPTAVIRYALKQLALKSST